MGADANILILGISLSSICSAVLIATWCLIPRWRTLLNYIAINQVVTGSLHLFTELYVHVELSEEAEEIVFEVNIFLFLASTCWSLCASMISYLKLVLIYPGKISCGKSKATIFSYSVVLLIKFVSGSLIPKVFGMNSTTRLLILGLVYFVMSVNMLLFVNVVFTVVPWCKKRMFNFKGSYVISLIGVGIVCEFMTTLCMLLALIPRILVSAFPIIHLFVVYRLIPLTIVVLFNKRSRDIWSKYLQRRRNYRLNNLAMQNIGG